MGADLSLKNQFLLAMPGLAGSYFGGSLIYLCEHNDDGAMGIMVNRPSSVSLVELMAQLGIDKGVTPSDIPVLEGGPVGGERGFILHSLRDLNSLRDPHCPRDVVTVREYVEHALFLGGCMLLSSGRDILEAIAAGNGPQEYLMVLGYAGWAGGQLEAELAENAWLTCPNYDLDMVHEVLFHTPFDQRVQRAAASLGIDFSLIAGQAGHA